MNIERQYIGARYVPKLVGEWDNSRVYEALSIVQYKFGSYTSRKPVPAGIVPTDTEYWVLTGDYNGQVEEYRQNVVALEKNVTTLGNQVTTLDSRVTELGDAIGGFKDLPILDLTDKAGVDLCDVYDGTFRGVVFLPENAALSRTITITAPVVIIGNGCNISHTTPNCIEITTSGVHIENINFNYGGTAIDPDNANNSVIRVAHNSAEIVGCNFKESPGAGISLTSTRWTIVSACNVSNMKSSSIAAFWVGKSATESRFENCTASNNYLDGWHIEGAKIILSGCAATKNGLRPSTQSGAYGACGVYGGQDDSTRPVECVLENCSFSENTESGVDFGSSGCSITNCVMSKNGLNGIRLADNYRTIIANNTFHENGNFAGTVDSVRRAAIGGGIVYGAVITGNIIRGGSTSVPCIQFSTSAGNNQLIANNIIENCSNVSTRDDSSVLIVNNLKV